jgi:CheY-like chemotaxis protein
MAKTILLIEDNDIAREGIAVMLGSHGYTVIAKKNGQDALDYPEAQPAPDLILLDMLMPILDGWSFLERRKGIDKLAGVSIIVMTSGIITREWAVDHGAVGFVRKPVDTDALLKEIQRAC